MKLTLRWRLLFLAALVLALLVGCTDERAASGADPHASAPTVQVAAKRPVREDTAASKEEKEPAGVHDPAHPPIDCPLRQQGVDPAHLRPFEDVEKYIAFLERPDRALWQSG